MSTYNKSLSLSARARAVTLFGENGEMDRAGEGGRIERGKSEGGLTKNTNVVI